MTHNPNLGICIPTYKRPEQLVPSVKSMIASAAPHDVPIVIVDDSADDTNLAAVAELQALYPHITHIRNERNLGIDRNILKSIDCCPCRYAWAMGEDDRMVPEGVASVLANLERHDPPYLYVNYASIDEDVAILLKDRSLPFNRDMTVSAEEFLSRYAWSMGFIGACVVRKDLWAAVDPSPYLDTYFAHVGVIMESIHDKQVTMAAAPLVLNRCGTARTFTWQGDTFHVLGGWGRLMAKLGAFYSEETRAESLRAFERAHGLNTVRFLCYARADAVYGLGVYRKLMLEKTPVPGMIYRAAAFVVALTPPVVLRVLRWGVNRLRRWTRPSAPVVG